jgi:SM-20-related protein
MSKSYLYQIMVVCHGLNQANVERDFEELINSFLNNKVGIAPYFFDDTLATNLRNNLVKLFATDQLRPAGIGNNASQMQDPSIRNDKIYWLDRAHNDEHENSFFDQMDSFVRLLNQTCYTGITGYEFHYTRYEIGSFYKKHLDQFKNNKGRAFSMIMYLNTDWKQTDGGELCIHHDDHLQTISPDNRKCVFFKSDELEHEVLSTNAPRLSITGWLRVDGPAILR